MRSTTHFSSLAAALCLMVALPANAAVNAYMRIEGAKQGAFKGEGIRNGSNQWIPIMSVTRGVESPGAAATGQASGKRQHAPIRIIKEVDASSPQLLRAQLAGELLKQVVIQFIRRGASGKEEVYQTLTLTNALVSSVQGGRGAGGAARPQEQIEITFQQIEVTYSNGKKAAAGDWVTK